ncbi:MAG: M20 family metallopeptidase [Asgard group archaeon]|nr:M20 family metallopeptidase [Asgard group archaeon]
MSVLALMKIFSFFFGRLLITHKHILSNKNLLGSIVSKSNLKDDFDISIDNSYLKSLLERMIEINSIIGKEKELAVFLAQELQKLGLGIQLDDVELDRPNIYTSYIFNPKGKTLTLNSHLDTVDVCEGWTEDPFLPYEKNGRLYGLGSSDMKAGIACSIAAIKALIESDLDLFGQIHFTAVVDEEGYGKGAKKMLKHPFFGKGKTDGILITEPYFGEYDSMALPIGMTGKILYKITFHGISAHAFTPEDGINAIESASIFLTALTNSLNDSKKIPAFQLPTDNEFGRGSFCALKMEGGYKVYSVVVPDQCEIILNRLIVPGENKESAFKDLKEFLDKLKLKSKYSLEVVPPYYLPYKTPKDSLICKSLVSACKYEFKKEPVFNYRNMITDANTFMGEGNIPTMIFGPRGGNIHAADEYVILDSLEKTAKIYARTFLEFQK